MESKLAASSCPLPVARSGTYRTEKALVDDFVALLQTIWRHPFGPLKTRREFFYQRGKTDVVALDESGRVIAFEAKLNRWRKALHQAYRNTCFAHVSYVVLPQGVATLASRYAAEFRRRGVGLCYMGADEELVVLLDADEGRPVEPWLSSKAAEGFRPTEEDAVEAE